MWKLRAVSNYEDGYYGGIRFPDLPGIVTFGRERRTAERLAARSAAASLEDLIKKRRQLPLVRASYPGETLVEIPPRFAAKLVLLRAMVEKNWTVGSLARELELEPSEARSIIELDSPVSLEMIRKAFKKLRKEAAVAAMLLLALIPTTGCANSSAHAAGLRAASNPSAICESLRPFGVRMTPWSQAPSSAYTCVAQPEKAESPEWRGVSLQVNSIPAKSDRLASVVLEGSYSTKLPSSQQKRNFLWAASSVFTTLGMELPSSLVDIVSKPGVTEFQSADFDIRLSNICDESACRVTVAIHSAAAKSS